MIIPISGVRMPMMNEQEFRLRFTTESWSWSISECTIDATQRLSISGTVAFSATRISRYDGNGPALRPQQGRSASRDPRGVNGKNLKNERRPAGKIFQLSFRRTQETVHRLWRLGAHRRSRGSSPVTCCVPPIFVVLVLGFSCSRFAGEPRH